MRTGSPADSSTRPPTSISKASPAFAPCAWSLAVVARSAMVAIRALERSCAMISSKQPGRGAGAVAVIGQHDRRFAALHGLFRQRDAVGNGVDLGRGAAALRADATSFRPCRGRSSLAELGLSLVSTWNRHANVRHVGKREAEEDVDVDVRLACFPDQCALYQIHPWRGAGPLQRRSAR